MKIDWNKPFIKVSAAIFLTITLLTAVYFLFVPHCYSYSDLPPNPFGAKISSGNPICDRPLYKKIFYPYEGTVYAETLARAEQGFPREQTEMGRLWERGYEPFPSKNFEEAAKWFQLAADQGEPLAQMKLGYLYYTGQGIKRDIAEAYFWLQLGNNKIGSKGGLMIQALNESKRRLSAEQINAIEQRIRDWKATPSSGVIAYRLKRKIFRHSCLFTAVTTPVLLLGGIRLFTRRRKIQRWKTVTAYSIGGAFSLLVSSALLFIYAHYR
ncbi:MAG: tetratricopeptide repeat protein [Alphaproteobacteria bacterium]